MTFSEYKEKVSIIHILEGLGYNSNFFKQKIIFLYHQN